MPSTDAIALPTLIGNSSSLNIMDSLSTTESDTTTSNDTDEAQAVFEKLYQVKGRVISTKPDSLPDTICSTLLVKLIQLTVHLLECTLVSTKIFSI